MVKEHRYTALKNPTGRKQTGWLFTRTWIHDDRETNPASHRSERRRGPRTQGRQIARSLGHAASFEIWLEVSGSSISDSIIALRVKRL